MSASLKEAGNEDTASSKSVSSEDPEYPHTQSYLDSEEEKGDTSEGVNNSGVSTDDEGNTYPEGGLKAWSVVAGGFSGMTACFGYMNTVGTYQGESILVANRYRFYHRLLTDVDLQHISPPTNYPHTPNPQSAGSSQSTSSSPSELEYKLAQSSISTDLSG